MLSKLELSVILSTYQRPAHLVRCLRSLALQRGMDGKFEVVVADDGSQDHSEEIVRNFARTANFPVHWITHPHQGFRVSLCRNDGVRASNAPYFLFTDSDCVFPVDHLLRHVQASRPGIIRAGDCFRFDQKTTDRIDADAIDSGAYRTWARGKEWQRLFLKRIKDHYYHLTRHTTKPKLTGYNIGISRADLTDVNGFDESFVGWGCEDDDLAYRLRRAGKRIASALGYTHGYHLWHPTTPSRPVKWTEGPNVERLQYPDRPIRCVDGLAKLAGSSTGTSHTEANFIERRTMRSLKHAA